MRVKAHIGWKLPTLRAATPSNTKNYGVGISHQGVKKRHRQPIACYDLGIVEEQDTCLASFLTSFDIRHELRLDKLRDGLFLCGETALCTGVKYTASDDYRPWENLQQLMYLPQVGIHFLR